jgi:hypothetical protein
MVDFVSWALSLALLNDFPRALTFNQRPHGFLQDLPLFAFAGR